MTRSLFLSSSTAICVVCIAWATGCSGQSQATPTKEQRSEAKSGTNAAPGDAEDFYRARQAEQILTELTDDMAIDQTHASPARAVHVDRGEGPKAQTNLSKSVDVGEPVVDLPSGLEPRVSPPLEHQHTAAAALPGEETLDQSEMIQLLATDLRARANGPEWPVPDLINLAALDLMEPGVFDSHYIGEGRSRAVTSLHPRDIELLGAWRDLFRRTREQLQSHQESADLAAIAQDFADRLGDQQSLRIPQALLCTRVDGYGLYNEFKRHNGRYKLLVGRRHRLIVYAELDRFAHREASDAGVPGFAVELTQDLSLYHASGTHNTLAWRKPNQEIFDFSRNRRRDFFVVQIIELPETLTVGTYRLKIRIVDEVSEPASRAERIIPIDVVADASAFTED